MFDYGYQDEEDKLDPGVAFPSKSLLKLLVCSHLLVFPRSWCSSFFLQIFVFSLLELLVCSQLLLNCKF